MNDRPPLRRAQAMLGMHELADLIGLPVTSRPLYLRLWADTQMISLVYESDDLPEMKWNTEPPIRWHRKTEVVQKFSVDDGPDFTRRAEVGSADELILNSLTPEMLREAVAK